MALSDALLFVIGEESDCERSIEGPRERPPSAVCGRLRVNQGLYNGFLAAGLVLGLLLEDPAGFKFRLFFLACILVAGLYGGLTVSRRILLVQALPAALALVAVVLAN